jgi:hypothetical protein
MDTCEHQISDDPSAAAGVANDASALDPAAADSSISESIALEPPPPNNDRTVIEASEVKNPTREQRISLLEFAPLRGGSQNLGAKDEASPRFRRGLIRDGLVAGLCGVVLIGAVVEYDRLQYSRLLTATTHDTHIFATSVNGLKARLDTIEAARDKDQATDLRRVLTEIKTGVAATRDFGATLAQLSSRVDRLEKDQTTRIDKLGEHIDRDAAGRLTDITARLEKLEKKPAAVTVATATQPPPPPPKVVSPQSKVETVVSNESTGSIEKPRPRLRGFNLEDVRDGYAVVDSRDGPQPVTAGDFIPGAGRVLRIERRGREWVVVTTLGVITEEMAPY